MADDNRAKRISIENLRQEDGAHELATSPEMRPYIKLASAEAQGSDPSAAIEEIAQLPLESRYV